MQTMNKFHYNAYNDEEFIRYADQDHPEIVEACRRLQQKVETQNVIEALENSIGGLEDDLANTKDQLNAKIAELGKAEEKIQKLEQAALGS